VVVEDYVRNWHILGELWFFIAVVVYKKGWIDHSPVKTELSRIYIRKLFWLKLLILPCVIMVKFSINVCSKELTFIRHHRLNTSINFFKDLLLPVSINNLIFIWFFYLLIISKLLFIIVRDIRDLRNFNVRALKLLLILLRMLYWGYFRILDGISFINIELRSFCINLTFFRSEFSFNVLKIVLLYNEQRFKFHFSAFILFYWRLIIRILIFTWNLMVLDWQ